ncbi:MAG: hypothetical protein M3436_08415 [Pseudomonadota bacterium]|nr:hypothetical protein [Pseudomonadota bacterium]
MIRHRKSVVVALGFVFSTAVLADGPKPGAYVSNQEGGITVIDLERMEKARDIDVGGRGPRGIGITDDGRYLITANKDTADVSIILHAATLPSVWHASAPAPADGGVRSRRP